MGGERGTCVIYLQRCTIIRTQRVDVAGVMPGPPA